LKIIKRSMLVNIIPLIYNLLELCIDRDVK
jgi:hypothetical protein